ncbi:HP1 family phage holin [Vibrio gangliei]|uniref:HP1 family phage holin n=1 Tax=Vibrio gangliei TaxID=2077090 RepID=UPI001B7FF7F2|nr:HP1 family phage holin [Vibrio gangliei]
MDKTVTTSSYVASVSTAVGGLFTLSDVALALGITSTVILFVMQVRLNRKKAEQIALDEERSERLKAQNDEFHKARMEAIHKSKDNNVEDIIFVKGTPEPYETPRGLNSREN